MKIVLGKSPMAEFKVFDDDGRDITDRLHVTKIELPPIDCKTSETLVKLTVITELEIEAALVEIGHCASARLAPSVSDG